MEYKVFRTGEPVTAQTMTDIVTAVVNAENNAAEAKTKSEQAEANAQTARANSEQVLAKVDGAYDKAVEVERKAANGEFNGKSIFVKYNTSPTDVGASDTWREGMNYIGLVISADTVAPSTGYSWAKFTGPTGATGLQGPAGRKGVDGNGIYVSSQGFGTGTDRYDVSSVTYNKNELLPGDLIISAQNFNVVAVRSVSSDGFIFIGEYKFNIRGPQGDQADLTNYATKTYVDNAIASATTTALNTPV